MAHQHIHTGLSPPGFMTAHDVLDVEDIDVGPNVSPPMVLSPSPEFVITYANPPPPVSQTTVGSQELAAIHAAVPSPSLTPTQYSTTSMTAAILAAPSLSPVSQDTYQTIGAALANAQQPPPAAPPPVISQTTVSSSMGLAIDTMLANVHPMSGGNTATQATFDPAQITLPPMLPSCRPSINPVHRPTLLTPLPWTIPRPMTTSPSRRDPRCCSLDNPLSPSTPLQLTRQATRLGWGQNCPSLRHEVRMQKFPLWITVPRLATRVVHSPEMKRKTC